jgi:hypothetical protein
MVHRRNTPRHAEVLSAQFIDATMKNPILKMTCLVLAIAATGLAGCKKNSSSNALAVEKIPAAMDEAFDKAQPEVKTAAHEIVTSVQSQEPTKAFIQLRDLSARPDLNAQQRAAAARAMAAMAKKLQEAAANGDQNAASYLHHYLSTR